MIYFCEDFFFSRRCCWLEIIIRSYPQFKTLTEAYSVFLHILSEHFFIYQKHRRRNAEAYTSWSSVPFEWLKSCHRWWCRGCGENRRVELLQPIHRDQIWQQNQPHCSSHSKVCSSMINLFTAIGNFQTFYFIFWCYVFNIFSDICNSFVNCET